MRSRSSPGQGGGFFAEVAIGELWQCEGDLALTTARR
jgi:hypothetical protein